MYITRIEEYIEIKSETDDFNFLANMNPENLDRISRGMALSDTLIFCTNGNYLTSLSISNSSHPRSLENVSLNNRANDIKISEDRL